MVQSTFTVLDVYKILPQTNCRKCLLQSCLAFAAAVVAGRKKLPDCPDIPPERIAEFLERYGNSGYAEVNQAEFIDKLKQKMSVINFETVAPLIGATAKNDRIVIHSMGKDFIFDHHGNMSSECHIIPWVQAPLLSYITYKTHADITGRWLSFREIKGGIEWQALFQSRP